MSQRGTTLVELMVSLALMSVASLAAASLIVQAVRVFEASARSMTDPGTAVARSWIRKDVHSARSMQGGIGLWSDGELVLTLVDGGSVVYRQDSGSLVRRVVAADGSEIDRRVLLRELLGWRWRAAGSRVVELEMRLAGRRDPATAGGVADPTRQTEMTVRRETLVLALRAGGAGSW